MEATAETSDLTHLARCVCWDCFDERSAKRHRRYDWPGAIIRPLRKWAPYVALPPILAGIVSFALCWGLPLLAERFVISKPWANVGFIAGYVGGGLPGAGLGLMLALKIRYRVVV